MKYLIAAMLPLLLVSCLDEDVTIVDQTTPGPPGQDGQDGQDGQPGPPGPPAPPPPYTVPVLPAGPSGLPEETLAADLGSDGEPRLAYLSGRSDGSSVSQIRLVRRAAGGAWTTPVAVSDSSTDFKESVQAVVSRSNDFTHVFWIQRPTAAFDPRAYYAQLDNSDPPAVVVGPLQISVGPVDGLSLATTFNDVLSLTIAIDRSTDDVGALWNQEVVDGVSLTPVIAGVVAGGAGSLGERVALTTGGAGPLLLKASPIGGLHAMYNGPRHRARTGVAAWTSGPQGQTLGVATFDSYDFAIAPDGDAYATWGRQTFGVYAARAPAGGSFGAEQLASNSGPGGAERMRVLIEPGTEHVHVVHLTVAGFPQAPGVISHPAADLGGAWSPEVNLNATVTSTVGARTFEAFVDATNALTVVWYGPAVAQEPARILARTRPSAGAFAAQVDLTAPYAFPAQELVLACNAAGQAVAAWTQGEIFAVPASEIFAARFTPGSGFEAAFNVSRSPSVPSHATTIPLLATDGRSHLFWNEWNARIQAATPFVDDPAYATETP